MKKTTIDGLTVSYHFRDDQGGTVAMELNPDDKNCIARDIDKAKEKGKLIVKPDVTLYWSVED